MNLLTRFERADPFDELTTLRNRMDRMLRKFDLPSQELLTTEWTPAADVVETKDAILIKAELPGMTEKDIHVEFENSLLTIRGERQLEKETNEKNYRRVERTYGKFIRTFTLPPNVEEKKIAATYTNGLLELEIPKKEESKPKSITVEVRKKLAAAAA